MQSCVKISHHQGALKQCAAVMIWPILVYESIFGEIYIFLYTQQGIFFKCFSMKQSTNLFHLLSFSGGLIWWRKLEISDLNFKIKIYIYLKGAIQSLSTHLKLALAQALVSFNVFMQLQVHWNVCFFVFNEDATQSHLNFLFMTETGCWDKM